MIKLKINDWKFFCLTKDSRVCFYSESSGFMISTCSKKSIICKENEVFRTVHGGNNHLLDAMMIAEDLTND